MSLVKTKESWRRESTHDTYSQQVYKREIRFGILGSLEVKEISPHRRSQSDNRNAQLSRFLRLLLMTIDPETLNPAPVRGSDLSRSSASAFNCAWRSRASSSGIESAKVFSASCILFLTSASCHDHPNSTTHSGFFFKRSLIFIDKPRIRVYGTLKQSRMCT